MDVCICMNRICALRRRCTGISLLRRFLIFNYKTTKAIAMKVFIISFGPNPRILAKLQTDRFRTFGENLLRKNK